MNSRLFVWRACDQDRGGGSVVAGLLLLGGFRAERLEGFLACLVGAGGHGEGKGDAAAEEDCYKFVRVHDVILGEGG